MNVDSSSTQKLVEEPLQTGRLVDPPVREIFEEKYLLALWKLDN